MGSDRLKFAPVEGAADLITPEFTKYLLSVHDQFGSRVHEIRQKRLEVLKKAHSGTMPGHLPKSDINASSWKVPPVPDELRTPGIEISGPASITGMFINALNPGPEGERAAGDLDDDEDSGGHRWIDTVTATWNRKRAAERTLSYFDASKGKEYKVKDGPIPFFMHREQGLLLDQADVTIDGKPVSASILGTALTLAYPGRAQIERGQGVYFYLPKLESAEECKFWREFFDASTEHLPHLKKDTVRAIMLVESLPAAYQMEECLHALGPYAAGLNAARWDFKASIFEFVMADPKMVWPDRFGVDIKGTDFLATIFRRLVAVCLKHDAVAVGGMAVPLPSKDDAVNKAAAAGITADKEWEAHQGFLRGWVAHIFHMKPAADPFKKLVASGWKPTSEMAVPDNYAVEVKVPAGPITIDGTRRNGRMLLEYLEAWFGGRGAKGIDSLEGRPGIHPALMEDLATARMSAAQIGQRIIHGAKDAETGKAHDFALTKSLLQEQLEDILTLRKHTLSGAAYSKAEERYKKSIKVALRWVKNYTELDFRPLGSYTRADLDKIAAQPDTF